MPHCCGNQLTTDKARELRTGNIIIVGAKRFRCAKVLFQPSFTGERASGIHVMSVQTKCDVDIRKSLCANVVPTGGAAMFQVTGERMTTREPKLTQSGDFERQGIELDRNPGKDLQSRRIEPDLNLGTDPYPIPERLLGDDHQKPVTEDTEETGNFDVDMPYVQSRMHSDYDSAENIADSDLEDGELRKWWLHRCMHMGEEKKYGKEARIRQTRGQVQIVLKLITQKERELEVKFISRSKSVLETGCIVFIKERRTGKSVRKFDFQIC